MDFIKAWAIALRSVRTTYSSRNTMLILFAAPIALTLIIGAAFSKFFGGDLPIDHIPVAIVNQDTGTTIPLLGPFNYGNTLMGILVPANGTPDPNNKLQTLISAQVFTNADEAIAQVKQGKMAVAIIIPPEFSASLNPATQDRPQPTTITFYEDAGSPTSASVVASAVRSVINGLISGNIADFVAKALSPLLIPKMPQITKAVGTQVQSAPPIQLKSETVGQTTTAAANNNPLTYFAPAISVFFVTFTAAGSASSIIEEQEAGTLQRMFISPTSRATILAGKLLGTYLIGLSQLALLIVAIAVLGNALGGASSIWGNNVVGIVVMALSAVAAATGLGALISGLSRTSQQSDAIGNGLLIVLGILGGTFFDFSSTSPAFANVSKVTLNYWATHGFQALTQGGDLASILPNVAVLLLMFVVFFGIGVVGFNRRFDSRA